MKAAIIKIGNSKGLRIPSAVLKQCGMTSKVNLTVQDYKIIITPIKSLRDGWEESLRTIAKINQDHDDNRLSDIKDINNAFDSEEWQW